MKDDEVIDRFEATLKAARLTRSWAAGKMGISGGHLFKVVRGDVPLTREVRDKMIGLTDNLQKSGLASEAV